MKLRVSPFLLLICWMAIGVIVATLATQSVSFLNKILVLTLGSTTIALALIFQYEMK